MLGRLFGLLIFLLSVGGVVYNWNLLINHGYFYIKLSAITPFGVLGGLLMMVSPSLGGPPHLLDKKSKLIVWVMVAAAFVLGGVNFYLMSNYQP